MNLKRFGVCCAALLLSAFPAHAAESESLPVRKATPYELVLLTEGNSGSSPSILIGADKALLKRVYPTAVNAFLLRGNNTHILVDTAFGKKLFSQLASLNLKPESIDAILLTHMHPDHIGGLLKDGKPAFPNAELWVAEQERAYWTDEAVMNGVPEGARASFRNAQQTLDAYAGRVKTFSPRSLEEAETILPDIRAGAAFGHTPGHTVYVVGRGPGQTLIWGDVAHVMAVQMPSPDIAVTYDVDPKAAIASRMQVLRYVTEHSIPVAGMHIPYPGMGSVAPSDMGGFTFLPQPQ